MKIIHAINNFFWEGLPNDELTAVDYLKMYGGFVGVLTWLTVMLTYVYA